MAAKKNVKKENEDKAVELVDEPLVIETPPSAEDEGVEISHHENADIGTEERHLEDGADFPAGAIGEPELEEMPEPIEQAPIRDIVPTYDGVLSIDRTAPVASPEDAADVVWHDIQNANRTGRLLTGIINSTCKTPTGNTHVLIDYNGVTVTIPDTEMGITLPDGAEGRIKSIPAYLNDMLNQMIFAEVDFVIRGIDKRTRTVVASRKDAMLRKVRNFYFSTERNPTPLIYEGRLVQGRVVAAGERGARLEVFGVERILASRFLTWDWMEDVRTRYQVGDEVLLRVVRLDAKSPEDIRVTFSGRDVTEDTTRKKLELITPQARYAGTVTAYHKGVYFIHLEIGVNAVAHANMDRRGVGVKDLVCFTASSVDDETGEALGVITRVVKRNL